jgi:4-amino-4-deoxy-L-arabinose transferase-like glycosyltransferase
MEEETEPLMKSLRGREIVALVALVLIGVAIRAQHLTAPFFYDEAVYVNLAQHPFHSDFYPDPIFFRHPPAHYLLLAAWGESAGYSEIVMRLPSLLFAAATIVLAYFLGRRLLPHRAALAATALLTFSVLHQQYAQAATMYAMLTFFVTLCVYGLISGNERLIASGFLGAIYTHYFGFYLAPSVLLFYYRRDAHNWKKLAGRVALYAGAYSPWIVIALQGLVFHANRTSGLRWWDFHWLNMLRQLSVALLGGSIYFLFVQRRQKALQPALMLCVFFLLSAFFLLPFQRYLVPFLPTLIVFGVAGLVELFQSVTSRFRIQSNAWRAALAGVGLIGLCVPNLKAFGIYPAMGRYLDLRDAIHTQEWDRVVAAIPGGRIATTNARSLLFYGNLQGVREYAVVEQFDENQKQFTALVEHAANDWIVLPKYPPYAALIPVADTSNRYRRFAEFDCTLIYKKSK